MSAVVVVDRYDILAGCLGDGLDELMSRLNHAAFDAADLELAVRSLCYERVEDGDRLAHMPYDDYLRTAEWAETRRIAIRRARGRCQGCDTREHLEVHHRTYDRRGHEWPDDLTVLCAGCHTAVHLIADARRGKVRSESRRARV